MRLEAHHGPGALRLAESVHECFAGVFDDAAELPVRRAETFEPHAAREGFRLVTAREAERVVGPAWSYVGHRGQFWSDLVAGALPPDVVASARCDPGCR